MGLKRYLRVNALAPFLRMTYPSPPTPLPNDQLQIPSRDPERTIQAHVYQSKSAKPSPVLINFHGGGFILDLHGSDDEFAHHVARETDYTVLDVAYRLAPKHQYPAATDDVEDAIRWVLSRPEDFDTSRIAVSGFSAGGNLALGAIHTAPGTFRHVIAFYPVVDLATDPASKRSPQDGGKPIPAWMAHTFTECYLPPEVDRTHPLVSPTYIAGEEFPANVLIITASYDTLAGEAEALADRIRAVPGKNVICQRMESCDHVWDKTCKPDSDGWEKKNSAYKLVIELLRD